MSAGPSPPASSLRTASRTTAASALLLLLPPEPSCSTPSLTSTRTTGWAGDGNGKRGAGRSSAVTPSTSRPP